ncbi:uncharacterized protein GGS22DRAFT_60585 [Annulohypoxylon maeteangense]|uniref:uncharacterized protein n=1 Tax=Annulohypoxylon maeteangense TaxID=1927788 RepID=UPI002008837C|nr:uncharacterized protein GGS22DRAFT_60585 [Annulohypoxylon maeteangense]KAI0888559.1 hypothetical protein GGS22DRAFT_60585 [Annulohypoxylon maeteangense]
MSSGTRNENILPLESFALTAVPASTHNVVWSPDAELAVGCDDCVYIFIPDFTIPKSENGRDPSVVRQFNDVALRFPSVEHRSPELNRPLFDYVGLEFPDFEFIPGGGGSGTVTSQGSSMNHLVALEWSPCGLGRMNRSVLAVLTGAGTITVYCEGASDRNNAYKPRGRSARTLLPWVAPWGVGAGLLLPAIEGHQTEYVKEYITAFAWARDTDGYGTLLAYANDDDEIVILSVQAQHDPNATLGDCGQWRVEEVARFAGIGPHPKTNQNDPDSLPSGSSFSLSWGPWLKRGTSKTSMISYINNNYVGFRQVTIDSPQQRMEPPNVKVNKVDTDGVCLSLGQDAFVVWEDLIWTIDQSKVCRGVIATPMLAKAFQVSFDNPKSSKISRHTAYECGSTYPDIDDISTQNPITGLVIHPPSLSQKTATPSYSLVRLSATHENDAWYQTNLPLPPNPEDGTIGPRWATEINQIVEQQLPRAMAYRAVVDGGSVGSDDVSDGDEEMDNESFEGSDYDPDENFAGIDTEDQVHINRARIWGMASSPGGGVTAVFISHHNTVFYGRDTFAGIKCRILFGRHDGTSDKGEEALTTLAMKNLSTEAKTWEWMYGGGPPVPGVGHLTSQSSEDRSALKDHFELAIRQQACSFCKSPLKSEGKLCRCDKGHPFSTCATTGLPILAPGLSRTCNVCSSKCLNRENLIVIAPQLKDIITDEISDELCGNCGGKFVN